MRLFGGLGTGTDSQVWGVSGIATEAATRFGPSGDSAVDLVVIWYGFYS